jgi:hypothetical protein
LDTEILVAKVVAVVQVAQVAMPAAALVVQAQSLEPV